MNFVDKRKRTLNVQSLNPSQTDPSRANLREFMSPKSGDLRGAPTYRLHQVDRPSTTTNNRPRVDTNDWSHDVWASTERFPDPRSVAPPPKVCLHRVSVQVYQSPESLVPTSKSHIGDRNIRRLVVNVVFTELLRVV